MPDEPETPAEVPVDPDQAAQAARWQAQREAEAKRQDEATRARAEAEQKKAEEDATS